MKVKIKRVDKELPMPVYHTKGAAGFDMYARVEIKIPPKSLAKIPGNFIIQTPPGHMLMVASRSSTPFKKGLSVPHGFGVLDSDYCGPEDEVLLSVYNFTDEEVTVERGERIAQGVFVPIVTADWEEVDEMAQPTRGGFGSTGHK